MSSVIETKSKLEIERQALEIKLKKEAQKQVLIKIIFGDSALLNLKKWVTENESDVFHILELAFYLAIEARNLEVVQWILECNPNYIHHRMRDGWTPFMFAAKFNALSVLQHFYHLKPALLDIRSHAGRSAFMAACQGAALSTMEWLALRRPELVKELYKHESALITCIRSNSQKSVPAIQWLLQRDKEYFINTMGMAGHPNPSPLLTAIETNLPNIIDVILPYYSYVLKGDRTHLDHAIRHNLFDAVRHLIQLGAIVHDDHLAKMGQSKEASVQQKEISEYFLSIGLLVQAVQTGDILSVDKFLSQGCPLKLRLMQGNTLSHIALQYHQPEMALFLADKGLSPFEVNYREQSAIQYAFSMNAAFAVLEYFGLGLARITSEALEETVKQAKIKTICTDLKEIITTSDLSLTLMHYEYLAKHFDVGYWAHFATVYAPKITRESIESYRNEAIKLCDLIYKAEVRCEVGLGEEINFVSPVMPIDEREAKSLMEPKTTEETPKEKFYRLRTALKFASLIDIKRAAALLSELAGVTPTKEKLPDSSILVPSTETACIKLIARLMYVKSSDRRKVEQLQKEREPLEKEAKILDEQLVAHKILLSKIESTKTQSVTPSTDTSVSSRATP